MSGPAGAPTPFPSPMLRLTDPVGRRGSGEQGCTSQPRSWSSGAGSRDAPPPCCCAGRGSTSSWPRRATRGTPPPAPASRCRATRCGRCARWACGTTCGPRGAASTPRASPPRTARCCSRSRACAPAATTCPPRSARNVPACSRSSPTPCGPAARGSAPACARTCWTRTTTASASGSRAATAAPSRSAGTRWSSRPTAWGRARGRPWASPTSPSRPAWRCGASSGRGRTAWTARTSPTAAPPTSRGTAPPATRPCTPTW